METAPDGRPGRRQGEGGRGRLELGLPAAAAGGGGREGLTISPSAALLREAREGEAREGEEGPISPPANALSPVPVTSRSCDSRYHSPPPLLSLLPECRVLQPLDGRKVQVMEVGVLEGLLGADAAGGVVRKHAGQQVNARGLQVREGFGQVLRGQQQQQKG